MMPKLFYQETGQEKGPVLVCLHGFCEDHRIFAPFQEQLGQKYRQLLPDLPGFGQSTGAAEDLGQLAEILWQWLDDLKVEEVSLLGHSMGGYLALAMLEKRPQAIERICLLHSHPFADPPAKQAKRKKSAAFIEKHGVTTYLQQLIPQLFPAELRKTKLVQAFLQEQSGHSAQGVLAALKAMWSRPDRSAVLAQYEGPVLALIGELDEVIPPAFSAAQAQQQLSPNWQCKTIPQIGHMGFLEAPDQLNEIFNHFF
ncbi:alpha/beta fold hydrolase [Saprospira grandis]|uniref:alpha/beta fold hydrolase n=1 Tax=Saprospira grandis TaxID=1008 RepID=UPI0022DDEFD8|nr:alpha/beta fold hydrolase [Saprospira grandis]WBM73504.1 alpha/beta fold hydrolase [Saprospira grandis]